VKALARTLAVPALALPAAARAQSAASGTPAPFPFSWLFGLFALGAILCALLVAVLLVRWGRSARRSR
jgi:MFS family permease